MDKNNLINVIKEFIYGDSILLGVFISFFMAVIRTIYSGGGFLEMILEGIMCGCLTLVSVSVMNFVGMSNQLTISVGGFIGFMGVKKISDWINKFISKKIS